VDGRAVGDEGEAWEPGRVESSGADDYVDVVLVTLMIDEASGRDGADGVGEDCRIVGHESFEVAWCGCGTTTSRVEVLGYHFVNETGVVVEFFAHFGVGVFTGEPGFGATFDDEFEALVEFVFDLFAVFEILFRVFG
tara:strand:- start:4228 stop:4638 length:411 start_codon:yes stop_codon:yes gene_type:complete